MSRDAAFYCYKSYKSYKDLYKFEPLSEPVFMRFSKTPGDKTSGGRGQNVGGSTPDVLSLLCELFSGNRGFPLKENLYPVVVKFIVSNEFATLVMI